MLGARAVLDIYRLVGDFSYNMFIRVQLPTLDIEVTPVLPSAGAFQDGRV